MTSASNREIAALLDRVGDLLQAQAANPFRARAYHSGADSLRQLEQPAAEILEREGEAGLERIPRVGAGIARAIAEVVRSGRLGMLDRLQGDMSPEDLLCSVPGIGRTLAHRIHETLGIAKLEELELAAHDGRLATLPGMGQRRLEAMRDVLGSLLRRGAFRSARTAEREASEERPSVETLLAMDARYREAAQAGTLPKIAPRRFNPDHEAWLPVLHEERDGWQLSALFSNTARAHQLDRTRDWVVLFCERDGHESQFTVVTEHNGPLTGQRVVRGREPECAHLPHPVTTAPAR
ncbi:MAG: helix-hairpin-helix domain-containing protein [Polyangiales bacterium]